MTEKVRQHHLKIPSYFEAALGTVKITKI